MQLHSHHTYPLGSTPFRIKVQCLTLKIPHTNWGCYIDPRPHWFWKTMDEREVSRRDLIGYALHTMKCNAFIPFSQEHIEDGVHLRMDHISHDCVGHTLSHTYHDGRFFPTTYLILDRVSLILEELAFQNPIKCKDRNFIWEDGSPHERSTRMRRIRRHP